MKLIRRLIGWIRGVDTVPNHPVHSRTGDRWDHSEERRLICFRDQDELSWTEIGKELGRTAAACKNKYYRL